MPYIKQEERIGYPTGTVGQLTYSISKLCGMFLSQQGRSFLTFALIMGALFCAALEFYRRVVSPYEDAKKYENGDVYYENLFDKRNEIR